MVASGNDLDIKMGIEFDNNTDSKLKEWIKQLESNKVNIGVDNNKTKQNFKNLENIIDKQIEAIKKSLTKLGNTDINIKPSKDGLDWTIKYKDELGNIQKESYKVAEVTKKIKGEMQKFTGLKKYEFVDKASNDDLMHLLKERKKIIDSQLNTNSNISFNTNDKGKITSAVLQYTDGLGKIKKEFYSLQTTVSETNNKIVKTLEFKNTKNTYTENIEKTKKALESLEKQLEKVKSVNDKMPYTGDKGDNKDFEEQYKKATILINDLKNKSNSVTPGEKKQVTDIVSLLDKKNKILLEDIKNEKTRIAVLKEEKNIRDKITKQKEQELQTEKDISNKIENFQKKMATQMQNMNTKYRSLVSQEDVKTLQVALDDLPKKGIQNAKELRNEFTKLTNQFNQIQANAKEKVSTNSQGSFTTTITENFKKFLNWYLTGGLVVQGVNFVKDTIINVREMDDALVDLNKVVDMSKSKMEDMRVSAISLGKELGKSSVEIMQGMAEFGRITKDLNEIKELTRVDVVAPLYSNI